ncbi:hypothetical protein CGL56_06590 [Neolewinella marina]|uniref:Secretion system C-terminal sorting domain-containing protein n=1 Tax=Neolewinella marina TaxID=438751 RepID=A0A2G0CGM3_9BACT|nr:hypothetical protein CGL56_06590 [Neolewinella marina]
MLSFSALAQFPDFETRVLDVNTEPSVRLSSIPSYFPLEGSRFFFNFYNSDPNPLFFFNGEKLTRPVEDILLNGRILAADRGGYLLYTNDGTYESTQTYYLDKETLTPVPLSELNFALALTFPGGRVLLRSGGQLFAIEDGPETFVDLEAYTAPYNYTFTPFGDWAIFAGPRSTWVTDGTKAGTVELPAPAAIYGSKYIVAGSKFYFLTDSGKLYVSDGTISGTRQIDFSSLPEAERHYFGQPHATANGVVFSVSTASNDSQLWRSDGSAEGTEPLSITIGSSGTASNDSVVVFRGNNDATGSLWVTNGLTAGTRSLLNFAGRTIDNPNWKIIGLAALDDGTLYFLTDEVYPTTLWTLPPGGVPVEIHDATPDDGYGNKYYRTDKQLFVELTGGNRGLYTHDLGADHLTPLANYERSQGYTLLKGGGILVQTSGVYGQGPFNTVIHYRDSTHVLDGHLGFNLSGVRPANGTLALQQVGDRLYGLGVHPATGEAAVEIDLVTGEQRALDDLFPYTQSSAPSNLQPGDGAAFFSNGDYVYGSATADKFEPLFYSQSRVNVVPLPGTGRSLLYFSGRRDHWHFSDGTAGGTTDLGPPAYSVLSQVVAYRGDLYFLTNYIPDGTTSRFLGLIQIDGRTGTQRKVMSTQLALNRGYYTPTLASSGDWLYFPMTTNGRTYRLWRSNGTVAGTQAVSGLPANAQAFPLTISGTSGAVSFQVEHRSGDPALSTYLLRDDTGEALLLPDADLKSYAAPIRLSGHTLYLNKQGLNLLRDGSTQPDLRVAFAPRQGEELRRVDESTAIYTRSSNDSRDLYSFRIADLSTQLLLDELAYVAGSHKLAVQDSLVLVPRRWGGYSYYFDELRLVNALSGHSTLATPDSSLHKIGEIVSVGNRFLYVDKDKGYGEEVFAVLFGEAGSVATRDTRSNTELSLQVYPNPAREGVWIERPVSGDYAYSIYSSSGQLSRNGRYSGTRAFVETADLPAGTYWLRLVDLGSQSFGLRRVVITK